MAAFPNRGGTTMRDLVKKLLETQLAMYRDGKTKIEDSEILSDLVDQIIRAHGPDGWVREGFKGLKQLTVKEAMEYLDGDQFKKHDRYLKADDLEVGMTVILHHAKTRNNGCWGHSCRVRGIELPYILLEPAVKSINEQELIVTEFSRLALRACSEEYFKAQRQGNRIQKEEAPVNPDRLPF